MDWITDMSTYATWGFPVNKIPCNPRDHMLGRWCRLEGLVQDQLDNGVDAASGQLSPCATPSRNRFRHAALAEACACVGAQRAVAEQLHQLHAHEDRLDAARAQEVPRLLGRERSSLARHVE